MQSTLPKSRLFTVLVSFFAIIGLVVGTVPSASATTSQTKHCGVWGEWNSTVYSPTKTGGLFRATMYVRAVTKTKQQFCFVMNSNWVTPSTRMTIDIGRIPKGKTKRVPVVKVTTTKDRLSAKASFVRGERMMTKLSLSYTGANGKKHTTTLRIEPFIE